jgi:hypothetical protein
LLNDEVAAVNYRFRVVGPAVGTTYIWQNETYHCALIDQLLQTMAATPATLDDEVVASLHQFCARADAAVPSNQIATEGAYQNLLTNLPLKAANLTAAGSNPYDWQTDYTYQLLTQGLNMNAYRLRRNVALFGERIIRGQYQAESGGLPSLYPYSLDSHLDLALTSYALLTQNWLVTTAEGEIADDAATVRLLSPLGRYNLTLELLYGLQLYQTANENKAVEVAPLIAAIKNQLPVLQSADLAQAFAAMNYDLVGETCFLQKVVAPTLGQTTTKSALQQMKTAVLGLYQSQNSGVNSGDQHPFYAWNGTLDTTSVVTYNLADNGLLAACLFSDV